MHASQLLGNMRGKRMARKLAPQQQPAALSLMPSTSGSGTTMRVVSARAATQRRQNAAQTLKQVSDLVRDPSSITNTVKDIVTDMDVDELEVRDVKVRRFGGPLAASHSFSGSRPTTS